jgi:hypothetical protein
VKPAPSIHSQWESRSFHGEGHARCAADRSKKRIESSRGRGRSTRRMRSAEHGRPVCASRSRRSGSYKPKAKLSGAQGVRGDGSTDDERDEQRVRREASPSLVTSKKEESARA